MAEAKKSVGAPDSVALVLSFLFWYIGNTFYNQYNTMALKAVGGKTGGLTMTVSTMQLGVCAGVPTGSEPAPLVMAAHSPVA